MNLTQLLQETKLTQEEILFIIKFLEDEIEFGKQGELQMKFAAKVVELSEDMDVPINGKEEFDEYNKTFIEENRMFANIYEKLKPLKELFE